MISVNNITKTFGEVKAVDSLSFDIKEGEIVGLLGPNGAGKTTTMRVMSGYYSPDRGDVLIEDVSVVLDPVKAQYTMGYLPENNPLYKDMLVSDFLNFSGSLRGLSKKELNDGLKFVLSSVNLKDVYYRSIKELSKGFRQRVGIAAALLHRPKVLVMDEPTEGLDPIQRNDIRNLIKDLSKKHTIVISTHVMQEVEAVCTRMIIIDKGKKVADGLVADLIKGLGNEHIYDIELEGDGIEQKLKSLKFADFSVVSEEGNKVRLRLTTPKDKFVQPELSKLIAENKWVVWNMTQEVRQLEDIFRELTRSE